jgi:hypothetical protein
MRRRVFKTLQANLEKGQWFTSRNPSADHCEKNRKRFSQWSVVIKPRLPSCCDRAMTIVKKMCVSPSTFHNGQLGAPAIYQLCQGQKKPTSSAICYSNRDFDVGPCFDFRIPNFVRVFLLPLYPAFLGSAAGAGLVKSGKIDKIEKNRRNDLTSRHFPNTLIS